MSDMPEIHTKIIATDNPPTGMGEVGIPTRGAGDRQRGVRNSPASGCAICRCRRSA